MENKNISIDTNKLNELIIKSKKGDKDSLEKILVLYKPLMMKLCNEVYIKNYSLEDLMQISYMTTINAVFKYNLNSNVYFTHYLKSSIKNTLFSYIRNNAKERFDKTLSETSLENKKTYDSLPSDYCLEDIIIKKELYKTLHEILNTLPKEDKYLLECIYFHKETGVSFCKRLNLSYSTFLKKKKRILKILNAKLQQLGYKNSLS